MEAIQNGRQSLLLVEGGERQACSGVHVLHICGGATMATTQRTSLASGRPELKVRAVRRSRAVVGSGAAAA